MVFLTILLYICLVTCCVIGVYSSVAIFKEVIRICVPVKSEAAANEETADRGVWLANLEQDSYIMSLRVVNEDMSTADAQDYSQEEIRQKANDLKTRLAANRSNYELLNLNQQV